VASDGNAFRACIPQTMSNSGRWLFVLEGGGACYGRSWAVLNRAHQWRMHRFADRREPVVGAGRLPFPRICRARSPQSGWPQPRERQYLAGLPPASVEVAGSSGSRNPIHPPLRRYPQTPWNPSQTGLVGIQTGWWRAAVGSSVTDSWQWQQEHFFPYQAKTVTGESLPLAQETLSWHKGCFGKSADDSIRRQMNSKVLRKKRI